VNFQVFLDITNFDKYVYYVYSIFLFILEPLPGYAADLENMHETEVRKLLMILLESYKAVLTDVALWKNQMEKFVESSEFDTLFWRLFTKTINEKKMAVVKYVVLIRFITVFCSGKR